MISSLLTQNLPQWIKDMTPLKVIPIMLRRRETYEMGIEAHKVAIEQIDIDLKEKSGRISIYEVKA